MLLNVNSILNFNTSCDCSYLSFLYILISCYMFIMGVVVQIFNTSQENKWIDSQ